MMTGVLDDVRPGASSPTHFPTRRDILPAAKSDRGNTMRFKASIQNITTFTSVYIPLAVIYASLTGG